MNNEEAKEYVNKRYFEILEDNPDMLRCDISNIIIKELHNEYGFTLTAPNGQAIISVSEDHSGLTFTVSSQIAQED